MLSLLRNKFNYFNNTGARMIDFIYHTTIWVLCNRILAYKAQELPHISDVVMTTNT